MPNILLLALSCLSILVGLIMIFAYIATRNTVIDIVTSFETQNSNSYEIRMNVFNRAITFLFNLDEKGIDDETKKRQLGEIFDSLLICANNQVTLATFEKVVKIYFEDGYLNEKVFKKFKACVRREFGSKKYSSKSVYKYAIPSGIYTISSLSDGLTSQPMRPLPQKPNPIGGKTMQQTQAPTGVTIVTSKTQQEQKPITPVINSIFNDKPTTNNVQPMGPRPINQQSPTNPINGGNNNTSTFASTLRPNVNTNNLNIESKGPFETNILDNIILPKTDLTKNDKKE